MPTQDINKQMTAMHMSFFLAGINALCTLAILILLVHFFVNCGADRSALNDKYLMIIMIGIAVLTGLLNYDTQKDYFSNYKYNTNI